MNVRHISGIVGAQKHEWPCLCYNLILKEKNLNLYLSYVFQWESKMFCEKYHYIHKHTDISEVTYDQVWWPILWICALHLTHPKYTHTHSSEHTHIMNTHPEQWAAIYAAAPGEQLGVRCLAQGHLSCGIEGGESAVHSLPPTYNSCRPETRTHNLSITSPTLTIRPRLPHIDHKSAY